MSYELWDLVSKNLVDWFEDRAEAVEAVHAYLDEDEADLVMLIAHGNEIQGTCSYTGANLRQWAESVGEEVRRSA